MTQYSRLKLFFSKYSSVFILFICILTGCLLRTGSLALIDLSPQSLFLFDAPLLTSIDGYYYLNNAKMLLEGSYSSVDPLRAYPEGGQLPEIAPLLSYLVAYSAKILKVDLNWTGAILPSILSLLICIPVYGFANRWGGKIAAYFAVLVTMTAHIYATRTAFGMLDTDCMNVTFPFLISWFFFKFALIQNYHRYIYFLLGITFAGLFLWWWDIAPSVVIAFSSFPLLVTILFHYRPPRKEQILFLTIIVSSLTLLAISIGLETIRIQASHFADLFLYVTKNKGLFYLFPNTSVSNLEQEGLSFYELAVNSVGPRLFLLMALIGILQIILRKKTEFLFLLPVFCVGLLSITSVRFLIFLIPMLGIGLGYFVSSILSLNRYKHATASSAICIGAFIFWNSLTDPPVRTTFFSPEVLTGMHRVKKLTPSNATIYGWWDIGHPLLYWSQRRTLADGMIHDGERTVYLAAPLITDNYRFSANYMQFFGNHGVPGINNFIESLKTDQKTGFTFLKEIMAAGPKKGKDLIENSPLASVKPPAPWKSWLEFLFPSNTSPVYLFLEDRVLKPVVQRWLYWYGTWDTEHKRGEPVLTSIFVSPLEYSGGNIDNENFKLNKDTGMLSMPKAFNTPVPLSRLTWFTENSIESAVYHRNNQQSGFDYLPGYLPDVPEAQYFALSGKYCFEIFPPPFVSILQDEKLVDTLTKKLFLYKDENAEKYFRLVDENRLKYQLWQVVGDSPY